MTIWKDKSKGMEGRTYVREGKTGNNYPGVRKGGKDFVGSHGSDKMRQV